MNWSQQSAAVWLPAGSTLEEALQQCTHLGIGAHQDDLEFMAFEGIVAGFVGAPHQRFLGVTCTDGAGSARTGRYAGVSDEQMIAMRRCEQEAAAVVGRYAAMIQLGHPSAAIKAPDSCELEADLQLIFSLASPQVVYTHNLADKHESHVAVALRVVEVLRALPPERRPQRVIGCEVWRSLDWLDDDAKVRMNVSGYDHLAAALNGIFDSQIAGGKRYDIAILGRRAANATFDASHAPDQASQVCFGMDLTPLVGDPALEPELFMLSHLEQFCQSVTTNIKKFTSKRYSSRLHSRSYNP